VSLTDFIQLIGVVVAAFSALIALRVSMQVQKVAINVDGRLSQLLALTSKSSHAEGVEEQRKKETPNEQV
jgi:hypothetical protein